jgi:hypothetical protein
MLPDACAFYPQQIPKSYGNFRFPVALFTQANLLNVD